jgi:hypothetical protein
MLIGFMGAGGTGKTTQAKALCDKMDITFRPSSSRSVFEKWELSSERDQLKMTPDQQWALQMEIFDARQKFEATFTDGVCDRTLLDQAAYSLLRAHGVISHEQMDTFVNIALSSLDRYDVLCYFPLVTYAEDIPDMRDNIYGSRYVFDCVLRRLISTQSRKFLFIPPQTIEARNLMIVHHIEHLKETK